MFRIHIATAIVATLFLTSFSTVAQAQWKSEVGYTQLLAEIGAALEDGTGVLSAFIEAPDAQGDYMPDLSNSQFSGKTFILGSGPSGVSSHSSSVGNRFYGNFSSMSPGLGGALNPITGFEANDWLGNELNFNSGADPLFQNFNVSNHSYVGSGNAAVDLNILRRVDFAINQSEMLTVVGTNNGAANPLPTLLSHSYNTITVGRTSGGHASGFTTIYGAGRTKPEIVAPETATSFSTPIVSGAAAILHEAGAGTNAVRVEPLKAILLAGATKDEFPTWDRTATRPLDEVFGAGELNIYNSYHILQGGETNGSTSDPTFAVTEEGWDYEPAIVAGTDLFYEFEVAANSVMDELSIILTWNMDIIDLNGSAAIFDPQESLANMDLAFFNSTGGFLNTMIDQSISSVDNIEHIYLQDLAAGTYHLRVSSDLTHDFGLAWRSSSSVPEPGAASVLGALIVGLCGRRRRRA